MVYEFSGNGYALSSADSILTYTGNIGLYLALFGRIKGKNVYQFTLEIYK